MGSMFPIIDLNAFPDPPQPSSSSEAAAVTVAFKLPKLEPKPEPLDDSIPSTWTNPQPPPLNNSPITPPPPLAPPQTASPPFPADPEGVYSEFHRIQELFNTAFPKGIQNSGGSSSGGASAAADESDVGVVLDSESGAIVAVPDAAENQQVAEVPPQKRKYPQRSSELVRVTDLREEDHRYFREVVRRTRMLYDSIRIVSVVEESRKPESERSRAVRGDLRAASVLRMRDMWLNRDKRIVGSIPGVYVGDVFFFRIELCVMGLHGLTQAGIDYLPGSQSSNREPIATSVIVSGGYEDDEDGGDVIVYTGHGGQDKFHRQIADQKLEGGNLGMERSMHYGIEVRVIRGIKRTTCPVSQKLYVYDGLYRILETWFDVGKSGFGVYKFKLVRIEGQPEMGSSVIRFAENLSKMPLSVRPRGYLSLDISQQRETMHVMLFNDIDADQSPLNFEYLRAPAFPTHVYQNLTNGTGCDCVHGCSLNCICTLKNGGEFPYDQNGFLLRGKPVIFECGPFCRCPSSCKNRVTQNGLKHRLEVFRSVETDWGVRSLDLIHAGAFICEYAGVVLTKEQAQIFSMDGDSLIYPSRFGDKWAEWGDLSQVYPGYQRPTYPAIPPLDFAMDVSKMRNVACYIGQSNTPNVMVQFVLYDHNNLMFPHIMLFATEHIPPMRELSLDYGVVADDEWKGDLAICN